MLTDQLLLISLAVLTLVVLLVLGMVLYFAAKRTHAKPSSDPKVARLRFDSLRSSFRQAVELIENNIATRANRYSVPWIMVLNEGNEQRQLPIAQSGVASALSVESASAAATQGISWSFFDRGVVIDIQGAYLGSPDDEDTSEKPWDEFLGLCRAYRPQRPFDSVVVTIPAQLLLDDSTDGRMEIAKRAKLAHRRLWLAQNRFAMRFAVYVVVTGAEQLEGFSTFARNLPESLRASMLGWSSPYDLSTTYQSAWVDEAMGAMTQSVTDVSSELFAGASLAQDAGTLLLLPSRMDALRAQLQLYVDELMRPSAYHEPFFFRGIYLTGDCSESAEMVADADAQRDWTDLPAEPTTQGEGDLIAQLVREPAFLRDLFEKKIFLEHGLTRPSSTQMLARPMMHRALRWGAVAVVGGWSVGLAVATWQLHQHNRTLVSALQELQNDASYRTHALRRAESLPSAWYRSKALSLIAMNERLRTDGTRSFFMPGSWYPFDDLHERVVARIQREFGEIAVTTLRRELLSRVSQLSGVEQDEHSGDLIMGAACRLPPSFQAAANAPRKSGLLLEDQPEFAALQRYLNEVDQLDAALQALERLQQPGTPQVEDLQQALRYALGTDLPMHMGPGLGHFLQVSARSPALYVNLTPVQEALRCALDLGMQQLHTRLLTNNELLQSEALLQQHTAALAHPGSYQQAVSSYRSMVQAVQTQEDIIATGKGGWMRQTELALGTGHDRLLSRIAQNRLLGQDSASDAARQGELAFQKFRNEFQQRFGNGQGGIAWQDKEGRFMLSKERAALRDALSALLAQPFMQPPRGRSLPRPGHRMALQWDLGRLDQALAQSEVRAGYFAEGLATFPPAARPGIERTLNSHFARLVMDTVAEAATPEALRLGLEDTQGQSFEAARQRLAKVQLMLDEWGAAQLADDLRRVVSLDALERLRSIDNAFAESDLYAMRQREQIRWQGQEASPVLGAFAVQDAGGLQAYFGQQFARLEQLSRQADIYLGALDAGSAEAPLAQRWISIRRELERYRLKNPNSSLLALEQFLTTTGTELTPATCVSVLSASLPGARGADYFAERHAQIHAALTSRCLEAHFRDQQTTWNAFARSFNQSMAGRAPLTAAPPGSRDAFSPSELPELLGHFDQVAQRFKTARLSPNSRFVLPGQNAHRFVTQFEPVRNLLAPLLPGAEDAVPGYDLLVELRTHQSEEIEGNKIIDWTLEVGDQRQRWREPAKPLRWTYGTPISLVLRIAKDAPIVAVGDDRQPQLATDGHTITYHFDDPWALFSLVHRQRDNDPLHRQESRLQRLRFEFPLRTPPGGDPTLLPPDAVARVFLRMSLLPAGKQTPLPWPSAFPSLAPEWGPNS